MFLPIGGCHMTQDAAELLLQSPALLHWAEPGRLNICNTSGKRQQSLQQKWFVQMLGVGNFVVD
jgi:hypothetical protein